MLKNLVPNRITMLKSCVLRMNTQRRCLSYFSNAFNNVANRDASNQKVLDLDILVNQDRKPMDFLDKLVKLRKQKECSNVPLLPNICIKQLLDVSAPQDAINVLQSPLQYGIFIDQFTGCHLIDLFLHNGNTREAAEAARLLVERNVCNNELLTTLALKSFYEFLKDYKPNPKPPAKVEKPEIEKVRVKFVRNLPEGKEVKSEEKLLGESLIKLGSTPSLDKQLAANITFLGLVLSDRYAEAEQSIAQNGNNLYKDVLQACLQAVESLEGQINPDFKSLLDKALQECKQTGSFDELLDFRLKASVTKYEPELISEYEKNFQEWSTRFQSAIDEQTKRLETLARIENIETTLSKMKSERQNLWYFENKEDIDIQIFKKKVFYPKRWFGKKKKPRTVDTFYVPPTVSRVQH